MAGRLCAGKEGPTLRNYDDDSKGVHGPRHEAPTRIGRRPSSPQTDSMAGRVHVHKKELTLRNQNHRRMSVHGPRHATCEEEEQEDDRETPGVDEDPLRWRRT